jgi:putative SOS response-associated peptidase YedK
MDMLGQGYSGDDRYNVAPTDPVDVFRARRDAPLEPVSMRWWLTPYWTSAPTNRYSMFNAKAETLDASRAFREPFEHRRCLVPIAGFYEWARSSTDKGSGRKTPYYIRPRNDDGLLLAGIWDRWRGAEQDILSFAIVTTAVNEKLRFVHDRQPVMLSREEGRRWVSRESSLAVAHSLLTSRLPCDLEALPVSDYVNSTRNQGPQCAEPIGAPIVLERAA